MIIEWNEQFYNNTKMIIHWRLYLTLSISPAKRTDAYLQDTSYSLVHKGPAPNLLALLRRQQLPQMSYPSQDRKKLNDDCTQKYVFRYHYMKLPRLRAWNIWKDNISIIEHVSCFCVEIIDGIEETVILRLNWSTLVISAWFVVTVPLLLFQFFSVDSFMVVGGLNIAVCVPACAKCKPSSLHTTYTRTNSKNYITPKAKFF